MEENKAVVMYQGEQGEVVFDMGQKEETIWATQEQIAQLFGVDRTVVAKHLKNIYKDEELREEGTIKKKLIVRIEGNRRVRRTVSFYNLDAIISVGYRVNSKKATKFRVWATGVLKKYMIDGVTVNERRIKEVPEEKLEQLEGTLKMVRRLMERTELEEKEAKGVLEVISKYGKTLETIRDFDEGKVIGAEAGAGRRARRGLEMGDVRNLIENLREELIEGAKFGEMRNERGFEKELLRVLGGEGGIEKKAAEMLYFLVKERPFFDGNRRIGALLFI